MIDERLKPFGFLPGEYFFRCVDCPPDAEHAIGAKRCRRCKSCAEKAFEEYENREKEKIDLPCGDVLEIDHTLQGRKYYYNDELIWDPSTTHRVVLQKAIMVEDEHKYKQRQVIEKSWQENIMGNKTDDD